MPFVCVTLTRGSDIQPVCPLGLPPFVGENTEHMGTNTEPTRWWNAKGAERDRVVWEYASSDFFEKYVLGNALIACFEAVSGLHFYNIFSRLVIFFAFTWQPTAHFKK